MQANIIIQNTDFIVHKITNRIQKKSISSLPNLPQTQYTIQFIIEYLQIYSISIYIHFLRFVRHQFEYLPCIFLNFLKQSE